MAISSDEDTLSDRVDFLRQLPLFATLGGHDLTNFASDLRLKQFNRREVIFREGDLSRDLFILRKGKVRIFKLSPAGHETSINLFAIGDIIGEFGALDEQPRSATAEALVPCALLGITGGQFLQHLRRLPELSIAMTRLLVAKLRWTAAYAEAIAQYDAAARLLHILLLYNEKFGQELVAGKTYVLNLSVSQSELASLVGARREWVNHLLREWQQQNLLEFRGGTLLIHDLAKVQHERDRRTEAGRAVLDGSA